MTDMRNKKNWKNNHEVTTEMGREEERALRKWKVERKKDVKRVNAKKNERVSEESE